MKLDLIWVFFEIYILFFRFGIVFECWSNCRRWRAVRRRNDRFSGFFVVIKQQLFLLTKIFRKGENAVNLAMSALFCNGFIAVLPLLSLRWIVETRGQELK